mmetsp:Transcript_586/g.1244  ORF Transcript_586/g.1244 Transcript_586/m.1244 type:complete len:201 (-) Transcript_586:1069-1671(-)
MLLSQFARDALRLGVRGGLRDSYSLYRHMTDRHDHLSVLHIQGQQPAGPGAAADAQHSLGGVEEVPCVVEGMKPHHICAAHGLQQLRGARQRAENLAGGEGDVHKEDDLYVVQVRRGGQRPAQLCVYLLEGVGGGGGDVSRVLVCVVVLEAALRLGVLAHRLSQELGQGHEVVVVHPHDVSVVQQPQQRAREYLVHRRVG